MPCYTCEDGVKWTITFVSVFKIAADAEIKDIVYVGS